MLKPEETSRSGNNNDDLRNTLKSPVEEDPSSRTGDEDVGTESIGTRVAKIVSVEKPHTSTGEWIKYEPEDKYDFMKVTQHHRLRQGLDRRFWNGGTYSAFFPFNEETGEPSKEARAFICFNPEGDVEEIYGDQVGDYRLDDSLISTVRDYVQTLPGGEKFIEPLENQQRIAEIYYRWDSGEELTGADTSFLSKPMLSTIYNNHEDIEDSRLFSLKSIAVPLNEGSKIDDIVSRCDVYGVSGHLHDFLNHGADSDMIVKKFIREGSPRIFLGRLRSLRKAGANMDADTIVGKILSQDIPLDEEELKDLMESGANRETIISKLKPYDIGKNLDLFTKYAKIGDLTKHFKPGDIADFLDELVAHGAKINMGWLIQNLTPNEINNCIEPLLNHGANQDDLREKLGEDTDKLDTVLFWREQLEKRYDGANN